MVQGISLKSERNISWFKPWFNILLQTHTQSMFRVLGMYNFLSTSELKTLAKMLPMLGPNATSRKNEMTSGTFGFVSLAQQLPSKPKTQGWLRIYIWTDCKRRLTFAFVEINHDSSRLQSRQGRRKVWKSEGYNLSSFPDWNVDNVSAQIWVRGSIDRPSALPPVPTVLNGAYESQLD